MYSTIHFRDVFRRYKGPPELFTMWTCLVTTNEVDKLETAWMLSQEAGMRETCLMYTEQHGFPPHPAVLVQEYNKELSGIKRVRNPESCG